MARSAVQLTQGGGSLTTPRCPEPRRDAPRLPRVVHLPQRLGRLSGCLSVGAGALPLQPVRSTIFRTGRLLTPSMPVSSSALLRSHALGVDPWLAPFDKAAATTRARNR
jgi:hypothetical protein